jgi:hyperosmotically inducible periplasmic protein
MPRLTRSNLPKLAVIFALTFSTGTLFAQNPTPAPTWSDQDGLRVTQEVQKRLARLTNLSVFDWLTFGFHGKTVVVKGFASRPILKKDIDNTLKGIPGVDSVDNQVEVLPNSPNDDRIRAAVYNRIYTQPALRRYNANQGGIRQATGPGPNVALMAGGITNSPPLGFHAIHIIVKNGNVTLFGVVSNESDKSIAGMQANSAPGAFSVDNDLIVQGAASKPKAQ